MTKRSTGASSPEVPVPLADIRRHVRGSWIAAVLAVVVAVVLAGIALRMQSHEQVLLDGGVLGAARVIAVDYRRGGDKVEVEHVVDGTRWRTNLMVVNGRDFEVGSTIDVRYDPDHPDHARPVEGWAPTYRSVWVLAALVAAFATVIGLLTPRWMRADVEAATSQVVTAMWGKPYRRRRGGRWIELWTTHLIGLWPDGADRARPRPLSVAVESELLRVRRGRLQVVGRPEAGSHVVLRVGEQTIWTAGPLKEGIDPKATPG